jgi:hypothetical protein
VHKKRIYLTNIDTKKREYQRAELAHTWPIMNTNLHQSRIYIHASYLPILTTMYIKINALKALTNTANHGRSLYNYLVTQKNYKQQDKQSKVPSVIIYHSTNCTWNEKYNQYQVFEFTDDVRSSCKMDSRPFTVSPTTKIS